MRLYYSGAEVGAHRKRFAKTEIRRVAFNLGPVLNSGGHSSVAPDDLLPFVTLFYASQTVDTDKAAEIMRQHGDETSLAVGLEYSGRFPGRAIPLWNGVDVDDALEAMVEHGMVCVEEADILEKRNQIPLNAFVARNPTVNLYCVSSKVEALAQPCITDAVIAGWVATQKHREFQVWTARRCASSHAPPARPRSTTSSARSTTWAATPRSSRPVTSMRWCGCRCCRGASTSG